MWVTLCLQVLSNFANDLGDYIKGTDDDSRVGPARATQSGIITAAQMKQAVGITAIISFCSGLALLYLSGLKFDATGALWLGIGILAIAAAIRYTMGDKPYGYAGLGDFSVFIFFGMTGVLGSAYMHALQFPLATDVLLAACIGFLSASVLNLNNMRDAEPDKLAGKITMAVRLGKKASRMYHAALLSLAFICLGLFVIADYAGIVSLIPLAIVIPLTLHLFSALKQTDNAALDPELKKVALSTFALSILLVLSQY